MSLMYCPNCKKETNATRRICVKALPYKGLPLKVAQKYDYCDECGEYIFDEELDKENWEKVEQEYQRRTKCDSLRQYLKRH